MEDRRPQKTWRMTYWIQDEEDSSPEPMFALLKNPSEARMGVGDKSFISVKKDSITMSGGFPSKIMIQGLNNSFSYAGMIQDTPWPLTMIPSTIATPIPRQIIVPPLMEQLPTIQQIAVIATSIAGF